VTVNYVTDSGVDHENHDIVIEMRVSIILLVSMMATSYWPALAAEPNSMDQICRVIPKPLSVRNADGMYRLTDNVTIHVGSETLLDTGRYLAELLAPALGSSDSEIREVFSNRRHHAQLDASRRDLGDESYMLVCTPHGVTITGVQAAGVFYGVQTLRQLLPVEIESHTRVEGIAWTVPCMTIEDRPRFKWRGYLIDPARNFRTKDELKRYIDLLALQKMNIFQLHLTDDQGWRMEIKKYPKLVEVGSQLPDFAGQKAKDGSIRKRT